MKVTDRLSAFRTRRFRIRSALQQRWRPIEGYWTRDVESGTVSHNVRKCDGSLLLYQCHRNLEIARKRLDEATQRMLGRREDRTAENVQFERSSHAQRARGGDRGYGIAENVQLSRKVEAPAASVKVYEGQLDEDQQVQKEFLTVRAHANETYGDN